MPADSKRCRIAIPILAEEPKSTDSVFHPPAPFSLRTSLEFLVLGALIIVFFFSQKDRRGLTGEQRSGLRIAAASVDEHICSTSTMAMATITTTTAMSAASITPVVAPGAVGGGGGGGGGGGRGGGGGGKGGDGYMAFAVTSPPSPATTMTTVAAAN